MEKRIFHNPVINDTATFLKTSKETNGKYSLCEIDLYKSDGPPLHFHRTFTEKFEVVLGTLFLQIGKEKLVFHPGQTVTIPKGIPHKFFNPNDDLVRFRVMLEPGHAGMENFIRILYSLAEDGLTDVKGLPKSFSHLASILVMADTNVTGMFTLLSPYINFIAKKAKRNGTEKWLLDTYCT